MSDIIILKYLLSELKYSIDQLRDNKVSINKVSDAFNVLETYIKMADNYPVVNVVEQSVNNQVNSMLGNNDVNLKTIFKLSIMDELGQVDREDLENVINKIKENNKTEAYYINKEYELTYDLSGNVVTCKSE